MREHFGMPPLRHARIREHVGDGIASLVHRAITDERDTPAPHDQWEQGYRFFVQYYREHLTVQTTVYPGVTTGLGLLKALHLPLAVVTNKSERLAQPLLQELSLADDFALIIGGDTLAEKKPSALPLLHVCQSFGVQPGELLMVGDSANDALAARHAGCPVALMRYGYADVDSIDADLTLDSLEALYDLIKPATPNL
jgi:phosphoglycolate phosphatase